MLKQLRSDEDHKNIIEQGFTLVELLIVIVILGILAGIVVFAVGNLTSNAKTNACATEKSTISTAVEAYKAQNGAYTDDMADLVGGAGALLKTTPTDYTDRRRRRRDLADRRATPTAAPDLAMTDRLGGRCVLVGRPPGRPTRARECKQRRA